MTTIVTTGRTDLDDLFKLSDILQHKNLSHTPFLAFVADGETVTVRLVSSADELVESYAAETPVMIQWAGKWRSDFFRMTVADVAWGLERRRRARAREQQPGCSICGGSIADGYRPREDELGWLKLCRGCCESYDREHPRPALR